MPFLIVTLFKRKSITAFAVTFLLSICVGALSSPLETESSRVPRRIVSLGPSLTEELYLLGVEDSIVGVTVYCNRPKEAMKKEKVGTVIKVDVEKIISLRPEMVLATTLSDRDQIEKIRSLGVNVVTFTACRDFQEICAQFLKLGKIVGKEEKARDIIGEVRDRVASISNRVKYLTRPRVFVQIGAKPLYTVTEESFIQDIIILAGGINIAHRAKTGLFSREEVIRRNPDVVIIVTMGILGEEEKRLWERFGSLKAVRDKRVHIIDSRKICSPTPLAFVESLEEITSFLHPEEWRG